MHCAEKRGGWSPVEPTDLLSVFVEPIERLGLTYMVTGGVASVFYGDPRFTRDVDLVVELDVSAAGALSAAFDRSAFYVPDVETLKEEATRRPWGHFNIIHHDTGLRADIYVHAGDELEAWALERRRQVPLGRLSVSFAPPEYVIVRKLEYFRDSGSDRHLRDVAMMLAVSGQEIEIGAVEAWADRRGVSDAWALARSFEP
jgi:hypothetical protein